MALSLFQQLVDSHRIGGEPRAGSTVAVRVDQTLTQDATGTLVMLELESLGVERVQTRISAQYVDHNLLQQDSRNPEDHLFLESACRRYGIWFSRPGNGVSHPLHQMHFGAPGQTLIGSDSHTCAAGALGMLAVGTGGLEVALAMAGEPFHLPMPRVFSVTLEGELPEGVSAKDVILEMLRRHGVRGGVGYVIEYGGPAVSSLGVWDRHVIANMGAELGATATVFPADEETRRFLSEQGRERDFQELVAEPGVKYDRTDRIDLSTLVPLVAKPTSPGNVVPVTEVQGAPIHQAYVGSSANPGFRDYAVVARMVQGRRVPESVSLDVNPSTREVLADLSSTGLLVDLLDAGARLHQPGCNGCIGMGQAPATGRNSLRTVPRNFPGRSGTREDSVWLCSPETAAASALAGFITDPRAEAAARRVPPRPAPPRPAPRRRLGAFDAGGIASPLAEESARSVSLEKGTNIGRLPEPSPPPGDVSAQVLLHLGDDVSTDEILPATARVLPFRSNPVKIAEFCFEGVDPDYVRRAHSVSGHVIVAGENYGQGSSREHAALAPRTLGLVAVLAKGFARIHRQNLLNFGVLPATFDRPEDGDRAALGEELTIEDLPGQLGKGSDLSATLAGRSVLLHAHLSPRERDVLLAGGLIAYARAAARPGLSLQP
jgi:aconitate hydratase